MIIISAVFRASTQGPTPGLVSLEFKGTKRGTAQSAMTMVQGAALRWGSIAHTPLCRSVTMDLGCSLQMEDSSTGRWVPRSQRSFCPHLGEETPSLGLCHLLSWTGVLGRRNFSGLQRLPVAVFLLEITSLKLSC